MRLIPFLLLALFVGCEQPAGSHHYTSVQIDVLYEDTVSFRAIELMPGALAFAGSGGTFGTLSLADDRLRVGRQVREEHIPEFRAVAHTDADFFMLSAGNPALLYKTGDNGGMELVYSEKGPEVFYDAMAFWDGQNGLAVGDAMDGCLSILITRDGGHNWSKLPCSELPSALPGEGAFAASNSNIAVVGSQCWIGTTKGRVFYSPDTGRTWKVVQTPLQPVRETQGIYSLDFWDAKTGYAIGGDYTRPDEQQRNKLQTQDGGRNWKLVGQGSPPGYKSCVQYVPGAGGEDLVAVGFTGISYSRDAGLSWEAFSEASFYTIRFENDSTAYAAGRGHIARLIFKK